jgi:pimeloyl-ACP methyl ester carboxylesterase/DNA-binding winged helix-turn-helix (wHTH) protein
MLQKRVKFSSKEDQKRGRTCTRKHARGATVVSRTGEVFQFGPFRLERTERRLFRDAAVVPLTPKVFDLLCLLVEHAGHVLSKDEIMGRLWPDTAVEEANLVQSVSVLRRALGHSSQTPYIETVSRVGYRFAVAVEAVKNPLPAGPLAPPETRYTRSGDVNIAYQVVGHGPVDMVFVMGWVSHLEYFWAEPSFARFLRQLASFSRLILFDKRGTGLSDRVPVDRLPTLEQRMEDLHAVMDAAGSHRAVMLGVSEGGPMSALFAATYPERTAALVMIGTYAKRLRDATYPWGPARDEREEYFQQIRDGWGGPVGLEERAPSRVHDASFRDWWATYLRMGASPGAALALTRMNAEIDVRGILPLVRVPSLVIHRAGDRCLKVEEGRYVASLIPGARFAELPGEDHLPFVGDQDAILAEVREFVANLRPEATADRVLATVMCLDTEQDHGEAGAAVRREIQWHRGEPVGGGRPNLVLFDGPARGIRCANSIIEVARRYGVAARAGLHTGECDRTADGGVAGVAVEIACRVLECSTAGEVLVSITVRDLVAGSGIEFGPASRRAVVTPHGEWRLFRVAANAGACDS